MKINPFQGIQHLQGQTGYKDVVRAVLQSQIQFLVEQLSDHVGDETLILTASLSDGTLSQLGSSSAQGYIEQRDQIKEDFLNYCLSQDSSHGQMFREFQSVPRPRGPPRLTRPIPVSGPVPISGPGPGPSPRSNQFRNMPPGGSAMRENIPEQQVVVQEIKQEPEDIDFDLAASIAQSEQLQQQKVNNTKISRNVGNKQRTETISKAPSDSSDSETFIPPNTKRKITSVEIGKEIPSHSPVMPTGSPISAQDIQAFSNARKSLPIETEIREGGMFVKTQGIESLSESETETPTKRKKIEIIPTGVPEVPDSDGTKSLEQFSESFQAFSSGGTDLDADSNQSRSGSFLEIPHRTEENRIAEASGSNSGANAGTPKEIPTDTIEIKDEEDDDFSVELAQDTMDDSQMYGAVGFNDPSQGGLGEDPSNWPLSCESNLPLHHNLLGAPEGVNEGRFRTITTTDVEMFLEDQKNTNTLSKTRQDMALFHSYLRSSGETRHPEEIPPKELAELTGNFLLSVKKKDGDEYEPSSLRSKFCSLDRYLREKNYGTPVSTGMEFQKCREILSAKLKQLKGMGKGNKSSAADSLTAAEIDKLYESKQLGPHTPQSLINSLWMICTQHFGIRTGKEPHSMCWGDVQKREGPEGQYLVYTQERQTKTRKGNPKNIRKIKPKAFAVPDDPDSDPISLYDLYAIKRPTLDPDSPFFVGINVANPQPGQMWFRNHAMGLNTIYGIMKIMKQSLEDIPGKKITPYSSRKIVMKTMNDSGIPPTMQMQISGRQNVQSIFNYQKMNMEQQKAVSNVISGYGANSALVPAQPSHPAIPESTPTHTTTDPANH